jgi:hypothetical protein
MKTAVYGLAATLILAGCHMISEDLPTQPTQSPAAPVLTVPLPKLVIATPTPAPTPTPSPTAGPGPTPEPSPSATPVGGCTPPLPPPVAKMNTKIHIKGGPKVTLDTTPLVHDAAYCKKVGYGDRVDCPVRLEGDPERVPCETYAVGHALDTGRAGPTWYKDGQLCTGQPDSCENHPDNQYLLWAYGSGYYQACTESDVCGGVQVVR